MEQYQYFFRWSYAERTPGTYEEMETQPLTEPESDAYTDIPTPEWESFE